MTDEFRDFKDQVKRGFNNCRIDIESLKEENLVLKNTIEKLNLEIFELKSELKGINIALSYIKELSIQKSEEKSITKNNKYKENEIEEQVIQLENNLVNNSLKTPIITKNVVSEDPYSALLAFKAKSNKRDVLKQKMVAMITTQNGVNLSEMKFLFVDHYKYCSKATFYNYLKELELERSIKIERENSKNMVFLYNSIEREI